MKFRNTTPFVYGHARTSRRPPQPEMTLVVRGKFRLVQDGVATVVPGLPLKVQGAISGDVFGPDDDELLGELVRASDLAEFKKNAEVLLAGTARAPGGKAVPEFPVSFALQGGALPGTGWSKILKVVGPRTWSAGLLGDKGSAPAPFTTMPVRWTHAFGGKGYAANPVGKGIDTPDLPNFERPGEPIDARGDKPQSPAGFGPLSPFWPPRRPKLAKSKNKTFTARGASFYGEDFDWTYFQAAPADQQMPGYLRGDEEIVLHNLHAQHAILKTRLPGGRVRAFVKDVTPRFREVAMNLDTLFVDTDDDAVYLTWRGLDAVGEPDLIDVQTVYFAFEEAGTEPKPIEHYREALDAFERDPDRLDEVIPPDQLAEVRRASDGAKSASAMRGSADPLGDVLGGKLGVLDDGARSAMKSTLAAMTAGAATHGVKIGGGGGASGGSKGGGLRSVIAGIQRRMEALRKDAKPGARPNPELVAYENAMRDPRLEKAGLVGPDAQAKPEVEPGPGADLSGRDLSGQDLSGRDLAGANLSRAILAKANLRDAKLSGANLKQATLSEADLSGADLSKADLTEALLLQARAPGANFSGATLTRTIFHEADLTAADLGEATGEATIFSKANLTDAKANKVRFHKPVGDQAVLERASFAGAEMRRGVFANSKAKGLVLTGATLDFMSFIRSDLRDAVADGAKGEQTAWVDADLSGADFSFAVLPGAMWSQARAVKTRFFGANLKLGKFYRTILDQVDLTKTNLFDTNFTMATVVRCLFVDANLFDAKFISAIGAENDFARANLKQAVVEIKLPETKHARG